MTLSQTDRSKQYAWLLAAACLVSLFLCLGETLFNTRGEPREAVVALSMLQDDNWILPINNGVDMAYKPPFFHWLVALFSLVAGGVSEYTSRMPSALALSLMVLAGYGFYAKRRGAGVALLMGLITLTNFEVHRAGVACRVDMVLTLMMVLSLYQLYRWVERDMKGLPWWGILCLSGAFLSKGPVGAALPCLVVAIFAWIRGKGFWNIFFRFLVVGVLSCVIPLAWYFAAYQQGGQRFFDLVYEENVLRLLGKMSYASHINPWPYNVMTIVTGFLPYTLLVLMSLFVLSYRKPELRPMKLWEGFKNYIRQMDDTRLFTLLSFVVIFVFYCIPASKRSVYLLPVYPFLAYFLAEFMFWLCDRHHKVVDIYGKILSGLAILLPLVFLIVRCGLIPDDIFSGKYAAQNRAMLEALRDNSLNWIEWIAFLIPLFAVYYFLRVRKQGHRLIAGIVAVIFSIFLSLDGLYQPIVLNTKSDLPVAQRIAEIVPQGRVYSYRAEVVKGNPLHPFTINYYLDNRVVPFTAFLPQAGYLITGNDDIETFKVRYPEYKVDEIVDFQHKSCDDHRMLHLYRFMKS